MEYIGIADAHGLDSFSPILTADEAIDVLKGQSRLGEKISMLNMRAYANRHRHAVLFKVEISSKNAKKVESLYFAAKYKEALIALKTFADTVALAKHAAGNVEKSWNMIPNDDLDPYS